MIKAENRMLISFGFVKHLFIQTVNHLCPNITLACSLQKK